MCEFCENVNKTNRFPKDGGLFSEYHDSKFYMERFITGEGTVEWYLHNVIYTENSLDYYAIQINYCPICGRKLE